MQSIIEIFSTQSLLNQALLATGFTYALTAIGASMVFFFRRIDRVILDGMLGFAAGVMIAASFFSLLNPAIGLAEKMGVAPYLPAVLGFVLGGGFLYIIDQILPHLHIGARDDEAEGIKTTWQRSVLLTLAITLHNIPEGLAVGVALGAVSLGEGELSSAIILAIGIGIQNLPEGAAVSIPLRREGLSRFKSFALGQASGLVEIVAGVIGALAVIYMQPILPYALSFAAGAMIYVVIEELIPEAQRDKKTDIATIGAMLGFALMMYLDVALG